MCSQLCHDRTYVLIKRSFTGDIEILPYKRHLLYFSAPLISAHIMSELFKKNEALKMLTYVINVFVPYIC